MRVVSVFFLSIIFIVALYPSLMLTNDASDCYLRKESICNLSLLGEVTTALFEI